jgi:hypothetical protein
MGIDTRLLHAAAEMVERAEQRALALQEQIAEIKARKAQLKAEYEIAKRASQRLASFEVKIGSNFQCPHCWINSERRSVLSPAGKGTGRNDFFRCRTCGSEFTV